MFERFVVSVGSFFCGGFAACAAVAPPTARVVGSTGPGYRAVEYRAQPEIVREHAHGFLFLETEGFRDYGGWRIDTQFVHKMGSAYLIASGAGTPVSPARTDVEIPRSGVWYVWARTKDWLPEFSPGAFELVVGGRRGNHLGVSRRVGWLWERVGAFSLTAGCTELELQDLSGAFGRCDAILLTTDSGYVPPDDPATLAAERFRLKGEKPDPVARGAFDVIVAGAGPAGVSAAIAAARGGARTALVGDRPVLGGNGSDEIGVGMCGACVDKPAGRETGIAEEAVCLRAMQAGPAAMSEAYAKLTSAETNLTVFFCERVVEAEMNDGRICAVICRNTLSGSRSRMSANLFIDATGDGWLGYFAGAKYREGREGKGEFGEMQAPDRPDTFTMSGLLHEPPIGVCYQVEETASPVPYVTPEWAKVLPRGFTRRTGSIHGQWWVEHPSWFDDCADPERARDELIRISFAYWGWIKNEAPHRARAACYALRKIPIMDGRRESRRLVGDYILTAHDCEAGRIFPDAVAYGGWPLDVHDPMGMAAPDSTGHRFPMTHLPFYTIPFRALYSVNVPNLMMAGRDLSASHIALGSARVQQTCAVMGQAVGTAAAMCVHENLSPRELGRTRITALQQRLLRDDAYIPGFRNEDPDDLARRATVSASSSATETRRWSHGSVIAYTNVAPANVTDGVARPVGRASHAWVSAPGVPLPQWIRLDFPDHTTIREVRLTFDSDLEFNAWRFRVAEELIADYVIEGSSDGVAWTRLAEVRGNFQRHRIHRLQPVQVKALRVTVTATHGASQANLFEVRVY